MSDSPHLGLGYLAPAQAQKHVTVNEAFRRLDAIVQLGALDRDRTAPPEAPEEGDRHIVAAGAAGAWAGQAGRIAAYLDGGWTFIEPKPGWLAYVASEGALLAFIDGGWAGGLAATEALTKLGINASADAVNRLAVASQAVLFTHEGAGVQVKLNKAAAADVASFLFQRGYSGRAEFGLVGSDAFSLKVSADGSAWITALSVDPASGAVSTPATPQARVDKFTASGTWTKPAWASRVVAEMIPGGNGGGSGGLRAAGAAVAGGGGAAPAPVVVYEFLAAELPATVAVTVGAGGAGGASQTAADANGLDGAAGGVSSFGAYNARQNSGVNGGGGAAAQGLAGSLSGHRCMPGFPVALAGGNGNAGVGNTGGEGVGKLGGGGGGGGGLSAANLWSRGGDSGSNRLATNTSRRANGGVAEGQGGSAGGGVAGSLYFAPGDSGGGGAASAAGHGGAGGDGAAPGGSGGGGGAARNGFASGKGGDGARGEVWVTSYR
ncbi:DUF2793 domain-containing protein [Chenggangzhangella methanolivorans]|uniref:DUF2793 domain-containing protein n=1 Tax=Chenggangzhangella methanolivorans TaxID=1437009 RepID=UPI00361106D7